jgi:hypothetical protein
MTDSDPKDRVTQKPSDAGSKSTVKKPYEKPEVRHERVFETMALSCGKVQTVQGQCRYNRKSS